MAGAWFSGGGWKPVLLPPFFTATRLGGDASYYLLDHQADFRRRPSSPRQRSSVGGGGGMSSSATIAISKVLSKIAPKMCVLALDVNGVSRHRRRAAWWRARSQMYVADPLVFQEKTPARGWASPELLGAMQSHQPVRQALISLPLLIVQGSKDALVDPWLARKCSSTWHHPLTRRSRLRRLVPSVRGVQRAGTGLGAGGCGGVDSRGKGRGGVGKTPLMDQARLVAHPSR